MAITETKPKLLKATADKNGKFIEMTVANLRGQWPTKGGCVFQDLPLGVGRQQSRYHGGDRGARMTAAL